MGSPYGLRKAFEGQVGMMMEHEIEVKLLAHSVDLLADIQVRTHLAGLPLVPFDERRQEDQYLDTGDFALFRAGYSLRFRRRDGLVKANLKSIPRPDRRTLLRDRLEIERVVPSVLPVEELPEALRNPVAEVVPGRSLRPVVRIRTHRTVFSVGNEPAPAARFFLDRAWVLGGKGEKPVDGFLEVEIEDAGGGPEVLERAGAELMDEHGLRPSSLSKFERGLAVLGLLDRARRGRP